MPPLPPFSPLVLLTLILIVATSSVIFWFLVRRATAHRQWVALSDWARDHGYSFCGRIDADGQHPPAELRRLLELVRAGGCDVAVGSRFVSGDGYAPYRYAPTGARRLGTGILRRSMRFVLGRPFGDATSGMYAAAATALPMLAEPYTSGAPEVEAILRLHRAGLRVDEVPVDMRARASGESKLRGRTAVLLVLTVIGTLVGAQRLRRGG